MDIRLSEFDEQWAVQFAAEADFLTHIFADQIIDVQHFGSTSVPFLKAKPVIDMLIIVKDIEKIDDWNNDMRNLGYDVAGEWGIEGRRLFRKGGDERTHHIHFYQEHNPHIHRHLVVRDYLRAHSQEVSQYSQFKEELAQKFTTTNEYSPAKKEFVTQLEKRALQWFASQ